MKPPPTAWTDDCLWTSFGCMNVYQCGSCRSYDDPDHWSWTLSDGNAKHTRCGFVTRDEAIRDAENHLIDQAWSVLKAVRKVQAARAE